MNLSSAKSNLQARRGMVLSQLRPNKITDERILSAMASVPREIFLPEHLQKISYSDETLAIGDGGGDDPPPRVLLSPLLVATLLQSAEIKKGDVVLVLAGATGYLGAIAERLKTTVFLLDYEHFFAASLEQAITDLQLDGLVCLHGDPREGWQQDAPYNVIVIDGAMREVPEAILAQLAAGGKMVALRIRDDDTGEVVRWRKDATGSISSESLCEGQAPLLAEFSQQPSFVF